MASSRAIFLQAREAVGAARVSERLDIKRNISCQERNQRGTGRGGGGGFDFSGGDP